MIKPGYILPICSFGRTTNYLFAASNSLADHNLSLPEIQELLVKEDLDILIPSHIFERPDFHEVILFLKKYKNIHVALSAPFELDVYRDVAVELVRNGVKVDVLFQDSEDLKNIAALPASFISSPHVRWLLLAHKIKEFSAEFIRVPLPLRKNTLITFLHNTDPRDIYFSRKEIESCLSSLDGKPVSANILLLDTLSKSVSRIKTCRVPLTKKPNIKNMSVYILREILRAVYSPKVFFCSKTTLIYYRSIDVYYDGEKTYYKVLNAFYRTRETLYIIPKIYYALKISLIRLFYAFTNSAKSLVHWFFIDLLYYGFILKIARALSMIYYQRIKIFFPFYKIFWILEYRLKRKDHDNEKH